MSMSSVFKRAPDIGRGFIEFLGRPRPYASNWKLQADTRVPSKEVVAWCLAASALLFSAYKLAFGSMEQNLFKAIGAPLPIASTGAVPATSRPIIEHVGWHLGFGIGVELPQATRIATSQPQIAVFTFGASRIILSNVVPDALLKKPLTTILLGLYALITVLCLQLPARLLGGTGRFTEAAKLALNYYAYIGLFVSVLAVVAVAVLVHLIGLAQSSLLAAWAGLVLLPFIVVSVRNFFAIFSEYYALTKKRLFVAGVGSTLISSLVGPLFLVPCLYLLLWAAPLLEVVF